MFEQHHNLRMPFILVTSMTSNFLSVNIQRLFCSMRKTLAASLIGGISFFGVSGNVDAGVIESYTQGDDSGDPSYYCRSSGQTFTVGVSGVNEGAYLNSVRIKIYREGLPGDNCRLQLRDSQDNSLDNGYFDGNSITEDPSGEWITIPMNNILLGPSESYRLVLHDSAFTTNNKIFWRYDSSPSDYLGGEASWISCDTGLVWQPLEGDFMFEALGDPFPEPSLFGLFGFGGLMALSKRRDKSS